MMKTLELRDVTHVYGEKRVLDVPSFAVEKGQFYVIAGPNGSGKTTLLSIMNLLLRPTRGEVYFEGRRVRQGDMSLRAVRRRMTMVLQSPYLFDTSVEKNVAYGLRARGVPKRTRDTKVAETLELVGMSGFEKRRARELSGGETQLVALARALILDPAVLFLDEPTANVDARHVHKFENVLRTIHEHRGATVVMTTHDLSQAYRLTERVFSLFEGSIISSAIYNLFPGRLLLTDEGPCFDTGSARLWVACGGEKTRATHASIDPGSIIASARPFVSSARNQFQGRITEVIEHGQRILLKVRSDETFRVQITDTSLRKMGLTVGSQVYLTFKASSVKLL